MPLPFSAEHLWEAWERVQENEGCAGADGVTIHEFARHAGQRLPELWERVRDGVYRPFPLLKIVVEKHPRKGGTRTLLVPAVRDRVLQTAVARHLSRSFEEEFLECSYGYRPGRSVDRAIARIRKCRELGYQFVLDADIEAYFDRVEHRLLLERLAARQLGVVLLGLLRQWVKAAVWDGSRVQSMRMGIPQGSPISPLLANFFLEDFDRELEESGRKLVRYADDFLVLAKTREEATRALLQTETLLAQVHLEIKQEKTRITDFAHGFQFLGALFQGDAVWVPWKHAHIKGRILFMAPPMPMDARRRYDLAPPKSTLEIALERAEGTGRVSPVRAAATRSNAVAYLYLTEQGSILRKAGDRFLVEKDDEVLLDLPYHKLENVLLFGNIQVTTQAMAELLEKGVNLSLFSRQGAFRGTLTPPRGKNIDLRIRQFERYRDGPRALTVARAIVAAKIANGLAVLARYREKNQVTGDFGQKIGTLEAALGSCSSAADVAGLDGTEGTAARTYFAALMEFNRSTMKWTGRARHPAPDPLNALLSLTYTLLMHELTALLEGAGLDPYLGFLHQVDYGRPSLALDLMEPFRHPVADRLVLTLVNRGVLDGADFHAGSDRPGVFLAPPAMKRYFAEYEAWMLAREPGVKAAEETGARAPRFRDRLKEEVVKLASALRSGGEFEPYRFDAKRDPGEEAGCNTLSVTI